MTDLSQITNSTNIQVQPIDLISSNMIILFVLGFIVFMVAIVIFAKKKRQQRLDMNRSKANRDPNNIGPEK